MKSFVTSIIKLRTCIVFNDFNAQADLSQSFILYNLKRVFSYSSFFIIDRAPVIWPSDFMGLFGIEEVNLAL